MVVNIHYSANSEKILSLKQKTVTMVNTVKLMAYKNYSLINLFVGCFSHISLLLYLPKHINVLEEGRNM